MVNLELEGKVALVTGGTRGIGRAIALKLAAQGVQLILNYFRNRKAAEATAADIVAAGGKPPLIIKANVGDPEKVKALFEEIQQHYSRLDILVSNAASGVLKPTLELTPRHLQWCLEINAYALVYLAQAAVPMMTSGGKIIALSSAGATHAIPNYAAVGASKAALESIVRHLSAELAPQSIQVNTLSAGVVDTDALSHFPNREALLTAFTENTPAGRLTLPEDVADVALFLCSQLSDMVQGQTLVVDGGYSALS